LVSLSDDLNNTYLNPVLDMAPYARSFEIAGRSGNARQQDALRKAVDDVLGSKSAQEALTEAKSSLGGK
jgi:hypothetical protein